MVKFKSVLLLVFIVLLKNCAYAQENDRAQVGEESEISDVFCCASIICLGRDTLNIEFNLKVIYSLDDCCFIGVDSLGITIWEIDISEFGCDLVAFRLMDDSGMNKVKGCDVLFQTEDNAVYGLKSKNGMTRNLNIDKVYGRKKELKRNAR
jgi:hypothetical protein